MGMAGPACCRSGREIIEAGRFAASARRQVVGVVVHTGVSLPPEIRAVHPDVPVYSKPTAPQVLLQRIAGALKR